MDKFALVLLCLLIFGSQFVSCVPLPGQQSSPDKDLTPTNEDSSSPVVFDDPPSSNSNKDSRGSQPEVEHSHQPLSKSKLSELQNIKGDTDDLSMSDGDGTDSLDGSPHQASLDNKPETAGDKTNNADSKFDIDSPDDNEDVSQSTKTGHGGKSPHIPSPEQEHAFGTGTDVDESGSDANNKNNLATPVKQTDENETATGTETTEKGLEAVKDSELGHMDNESPAANTIGSIGLSLAKTSTPGLVDEAIASHGKDDNKKLDNGNPKMIKPVTTSKPDINLFKGSEKQTTLSSATESQKILAEISSKLQSQESFSTKKTVITTRSTPENTQPNSNEVPPQTSFMSNHQTSNRMSFPRTSVGPYSSLTTLRQSVRPFSHRYYSTDPSTRPHSPGENYHSTSSKSSSSLSLDESPRVATGNATEATTTATDVVTTISVLVEIPPITTTTEKELMKVSTVLSTTSAETTAQEYRETTSLITTSAPSVPTTSREKVPNTSTTTIVTETMKKNMIAPEEVITDASSAAEPTSSSTKIITKPTEVLHNRKRPPPDARGREGVSYIPKLDGQDKEEKKERTSPVLPNTSKKASTEFTTAEVLVSDRTDVVNNIVSYVKQFGAFKVSMILLAIVGLSFISVFCCCKLCRKKGYRMRQRKLKEFGQEKEFLLRDRNKGNKYSNDTVTLLDGSSEDEF